ncbi:hypothetical protein K3495_g12514 [Podosphaera aphanis]|nr:hypothetical protein K3495_g12514 [Podosphaera aphanis]
MTRIQRPIQQLPPCEDAEPLAFPEYPSKLGTKVEGLAEHRIWAASISSSDICAYSDGLSEGHGRSSWGFVLQSGAITFKTGQGTLNGGEVYDAELYGATAALEAALSVRENNEKIYVLLDNQAVVLALKTGRTSSSLRLTRVFHEVAKKANARVRWVPGHSRISENEEADAAARAALQELPPRLTQPGYITLTYLRRLMRQYRQNLMDCWWSTVCPARYKDLDLQMRRQKPPELNLPRLLLQRLIAARSGHGDFAEYHRSSITKIQFLTAPVGWKNLPHILFVAEYTSLTRVSSGKVELSMILLVIFLDRTVMRSLRNLQRLQGVSRTYLQTYSQLDARTVNFRLLGRKNGGLDIVWEALGLSFITVLRLTLSLFFSNLSYL